ncbi:ZIP zinc/iron transport family protein precursor [Panicum miliaceum]|uniref:ZIP zinc/iron transport family protein n=1 Tax=Panicum miliaceum TaxID=4540 RepID=A0A3L6QWN6_PANMI|nr:ZIP zinc/iron transport family protein precursor [Panicum miliaceum]
MRPPRAALVIAAVAALLLLLLAPAARADDGGCGADGAAAPRGGDRARARALKIAAFFSILVCGALGCCLPVLGRRVPALRADGDVFFLVKAFAAGVILATGFIHILPDAFEKLTSECLPAGGPWKDFPFAGFGAMVGAIGTLVVDTVATGYFTRLHFKDSAAAAATAAVSAAAVGDDVEKQQQQATAAAPHAGGSDDHEGHVHMHTHATHGHAHGSTALVAAVGGGEGDKEHALRHRVIAQVLELGIVVHSVIIGISLGASEEPGTIKPLVVALSFHQMFEGMGLGGCIVQAKFKLRSIVTMVLFFCLTTPVGILVGIGISSVYNEDSPTALVVEGILNSVAAGILVYMALVDLLAEDFMNPKVQSRGKLQLGINVSMLVGAGLMSMLAKWA